MKKELYLPYFKNKKITVMGLGLLGRGIGDSIFLAKNEAELIITDKKNKEALATSLELLKEFPSIVYILGDHRLSDFEERDFVIKAAGVPYDSEYIAHARNKKVPVYMSAALASSIIMKTLPEVVIIGITGTRGKSTTTQMVAHILKENGMRVHLGGNVRGVANLPLLEEVEDGDYLVLELDSWQLQGFGDMGISPHIAVFTSFMDDHMNYYKNDKELYFADKAKIYTHQNEYDALIASKQATEEIRKRDTKIAIITPEEVHFEMNLIGEHNQSVAQLAYEVGLQCGLDEESIKASIKTFTAVDGRLEDKGLFQKGVRIFNDNNATTGDATIAALNAINTTYNKKPILIVGGADKGLSLDLLEQAIKEQTKEVVYLAGTGTERISLDKKYQCEQLKDCIKQAFELADQDDIILYSPSFASFSPYFNNEYEKNDAFVKAIENYR